MRRRRPQRGWSPLPHSGGPTVWPGLEARSAPSAQLQRHRRIAWRLLLCGLVAPRRDLAIFRDVRCRQPCKCADRDVATPIGCLRRPRRDSRPSSRCLLAVRTRRRHGGEPRSGHLRPGRGIGCPDVATGQAGAAPSLRRRYGCDCGRIDAGGERCGRLTGAILVGQGVEESAGVLQSVAVGVARLSRWRAGTTLRGVRPGSEWAPVGIAGELDFNAESLRGAVDLPQHSLHLGWL
jgi:hypothetical protein